MDVKTPALAIYGAGHMAQFEVANVKRHGYIPACFCDRDENKHGTVLSGLPVMSIEQAKMRFGTLNYWVCAGLQQKPLIIDYLINTMNIDSSHILNYEEPELFEEYRGCLNLESGLVITPVVIAACGVFNEGHSRKIPLVKWTDYNGCIDSTIQAYKEMRDKFIELTRNNENPCGNCAKIKVGRYPKNKRLHSCCISNNYICHLSCYYCYTVKQPVKRNNPPDWPHDYKALIRIMEKHGLLHKNIVFRIGGGEITLDPERKQMFEAFSDYQLEIATTGVKYDELIAKPGNILDISVDSGTAGTYTKIKGSNRFDEVWANIKKYNDSGADVHVKYIVLPENSNEENAEGFIQNVIDSKLNTIVISSDYYRKGSHTENQINIIARMINTLEDNKITAILCSSFVKSEADTILTKCREIAATKGRI